MCGVGPPPCTQVRKEPETTAAERGILKKGTIVSVDMIKGEWVRLDDEQPEPPGPTGGGGDGWKPPAGAAVGATSDPGAYGGGWMLTDGKALKLGTLLTPHIIETPPGTKWQVTREGGCGVGYKLPGGRAANGSDDGEPLAECAEGASVEVSAECGLWARVVTANGGSAWVEMDCFFAG